MTDRDLDVTLDLSELEITVDIDKSSMGFDVEMESSGGYATYTGSYTATPETYNEVTMPTKGYLMGDNVTVERIPQFEVSNDAGGSTLIIGEEYFRHG